jgi:1,4-alpha-glucan branching enzyme
VVVNFTPEVRYGYKLKVPRPGRWREILNSDAAIYGGSNVGNAGSITTLDRSSGPELDLTVPPLAGLFLIPEG